MNVIARALDRTVVGLFILSLGLLAHAQATDKKHEVTIGVIAPLTTGQASRGEDIRRVLDILLPQFSAESERYNYRYTIDDGKCGVGSSATSIAMKFINVDKINFLITGCSGETLQVGPIAENRGVLDFAVLSNHPDIRKLGDYVFRTFIDAESGVRTLAKHVKADQIGPIAILTEENAFTLGIKALLQRELGAQIVMSEDFPIDTVDYAAILLKVKRSGARAVYLNTLADGSLATLVNQLKIQRFSLPMYTYLMPEVPAFRVATGHNSDGIIFLGSPERKDPAPEYLALIDQLNERFHGNQSYDLLIQATFNAVKAITDSIEVVGPEPARVKDYLKTYRGKGAAGPLAFDDNGDILNLEYTIKRMNSDGTTELLTFPDKE